MNFVASLVGNLKKQDPDTLPFEPIGSFIPCLSKERSFLVAEKANSATGEDFDVTYLDTSVPFMAVRGSTLSLIPGVTEMSVSAYNSEGQLQLVAKLKRNKKGIALYRDTEKFFDSEIICTLKRDKTSEEKFYVFADKEMVTPVYTFVGEFVGRDILMKNAKGEPVAKIDTKKSAEGTMMTAAAVATGMENFVDYSDVQSYKVEIAQGMDPVFVLALVCAIDEEFDQERKKDKK